MYLYLNNLSFHLNSQVIPQRQGNAKQHVDDTDNDGNLHLEGVLEDDLVLCKLK